MFSNQSTKCISGNEILQNQIVQQSSYSERNNKKVFQFWSDSKYNLWCKIVKQCFFLVSRYTFYQIYNKISLNTNVVFLNNLRLTTENLQNYFKYNNYNNIITDDKFIFYFGNKRATIPELA